MAKLGDTSHAQSMRNLLILGNVVLLTSLAGSFWVGKLLVAPAFETIGPPPPWLNAREVAFNSSSGSVLRAWVAPGTNGSGVVILAHSVRSNRREMIGRAKFLQASGYSVLLFDQQAHGESPGRNITFGHLESRDARAAVAYVRAHWPDERIGYLGVSQGGAAALIGNEPIEIDALVVESVFPTLYEAMMNRLTIRLGPLGRLAAPLLWEQYRLRFGIDGEEVAPIRGIAAIRAPLLLIAGGKDRRTTRAESKRMFSAAPQPKELWVLPHAAHQNFHRLEPRNYERRVLQFFARYLRRSAD